MGQAVDIPVVEGPAHYIVQEQGDAMYCREAVVIGAGAGRMPAGMVLTMLKANRTITGADGVARTLTAGQYSFYQDGDDNACILWQGIDARTTGAKRTITARDTQVQKAKLTFGFAATDAQLLTAISLLAAKGILMR